LHELDYIEHRQHPCDCYALRRDRKAGARRTMSNVRLRWSTTTKSVRSNWSCATSFMRRQQRPQRRRWWRMAVDEMTRRTDGPDQTTLASW